MPQSKELTQAEIQEIVSLRGVEPAADVRKRFGIGTSWLYRIWKNDAEASGQAAPAANGQAAKQGAPAAPGKGQAAKQVAPATNGAATPGTGQTALAPAGVDVAVLLQTLGRVEEQMGRLEKQQALLLEAQEGHYEDLEELEGTVDQAIEEGTSILDNLEAGSYQARTTAENVLAATNSAKDAVLGLLVLGGLGLLLWMLSWKALATSSSQPEAAPSTSQQDGTREPPTIAKAPRQQRHQRQQRKGGSAI